MKLDLPKACWKSVGIAEVNTLAVAAAAYVPAVMDL